MSGEDDFIDYNDEEEQQGEYTAKPAEEKDIKKLANLLSLFPQTK